MPLTMHQASVPVFKQLLLSLSDVLDKADAYCAATGTKPEDMLASRLAPDMYTLTQQVQRATFHAGNAVARLAGIEAPDEADEETSFADLHARIDRTLAFLDAVTPAQLDGSETRTIEQPTRVATFTFPGQVFLLQFAFPQFFFHATTAYDLIRHAGVEVGKVDYMGGVLR